MDQKDINLKSKPQEDNQKSTDSTPTSSESKEIEKLKKEDERQQKRLEKSYAKPRLGERIWLIFSPIVVLALILYYAYIGFLTYQHTLGTHTPSGSLSEMNEGLTSDESVELNELIEELEKKTYQGFSNYNNLNVRSEPSEASTILGTLSLNEEVKILELATESLNWHKIDYQGQDAYVREDFIVVSELTESLNNEETEN